MQRAVLIFFMSTSWILAAPMAPAASEVSSVPLRIISKSSDAILGNSILGRPPANYTLSLRNDSNKTITAWRLSCLYAENDGNFGVAGLEEDAFFNYERGTPTDSGQEGPIDPGDVREIVVPRGERVPAAPYEAMSCGVDAVVFADRSHSGMSSVVDRIFEERARIADDARRAIEMVNRWTDQRQPRGGDLPNANHYAEALREAAGDPARLSGLLSHLQEQVEVVEKHLPHHWRERNQAFQGDDR